MSGAAATPGCPLCEGDGGALLWRDDRCRVILAGERRHPAFCRVIWNRHVREMTDLAVADRRHFMDVVFAVETALRELAQPDKINLASLGNQVPHLHWHVIPRFADDDHFPDAVWAPARRAGVARGVDPAALVARLASLL